MLKIHDRIEKSVSDNGEYEIAGDGGFDYAQSYEALLKKIENEITEDNENIVQRYWIIL